MKRTRTFLRLILGGALLILVVLVVCLSPNDYRPFVGQPYFSATTERLSEATATNNLFRGALRAGFGSARLTPELNATADAPELGRFSALPLAGYGDRRGQSAAGAHDDLFVKAVAFEVDDQLALMFGIDALIVPREVADGAAAILQEELGLLREQLYFSATHTHCSLGGWGEGLVGELFAGEFNAAARVWFIQQIVTAARNAIADLQPASFGSGQFDAPEFVRNRLVGELGEVNTAFSYLLVEQDQGRRAILGSYSAHATVLPSSVVQFSGDYPGYWQRALEESTGGMALFLAGSVGSHGPVPGGKGFAGADRMGTALATELLARLSATPLTNVITFGLVGIPVDLPSLHLRVTSHIRFRPWLGEEILPVQQDTFLQAFRLQDALWFSTPCDFSGELALDLQNFFRGRGLDATITSFNGDYIGYVTPGKYFHLPGYETRMMSFFGPSTAPYFMHLLKAMGLKLTGTIAPAMNDEPEPALPTFSGFSQ